MTSRFVIAVNGHAATGKGTLARLLASELAIEHYDFGLLYRALAHFRAGQDWSEIQSLIKVDRLKMERGRIVLDGVDLTEQLRSEQAGLRAAELAGRDETALMAAAKQFIKELNFVVDGRTVSQSFPDAKFHFQVVSDPEIAKQRRVDDGGDAGTFDRRRQLDEGRVVVAPKAIVIDTTAKTVAQSLSEMLGYIHLTPHLRTD